MKFKKIIVGLVISLILGQNLLAAGEITVVASMHINAKINTVGDLKDLTEDSVNKKPEIDIKKGPLNVEGIATNKTNVSVNLNYRIPDLVTVNEKPLTDEEKAANKTNENKIALDFYNPLNKNIYNEIAAITNHTGTVKVDGTILGKAVPCSAIKAIQDNKTTVTFKIKNADGKEEEKTEIASPLAEDQYIAFFGGKLSDLDTCDDSKITINKEMQMISDPNIQGDVGPVITEAQRAALKPLWNYSHGASTYTVKKNDTIYLNACRSYSRDDDKGNFTKMAERITWEPLSSQSIDLDSTWKTVTPLSSQNMIIDLAKDDKTNIITTNGFSASLLESNKCILAINVFDDFGQTFKLKINGGADEFIIEIKVKVAETGNISQEELDKAKIAVPHMIEWNGEDENDSKSKLTFNFNLFKDTFLKAEDVKNVKKISVYNQTDLKNKGTAIQTITVEEGKFFSTDPKKSSIEFSNPGLYAIEILGEGDKPYMNGNLDFILNIPWFNMNKSKLVVLGQPEKDYSISKGIMFDGSEVETDANTIDLFRKSFNMKEIYKLDKIGSLRDPKFKAANNDISSIRYWLPLDSVKTNLSTDANGKIITQYLAFYFINEVSMKEKDGTITTVKYVITAKQDVKISLPKTTTSYLPSFFINNAQADTSTVDIEVQGEKEKFINVANEVISTAEYGGFKTSDKFNVKNLFLPIDAKYQVHAFYKTDTKVNYNEGAPSFSSNPEKPVILYQKYPELATEMKSEFEKNLPPPVSSSPSSPGNQTYIPNCNK